MTDQLFSRRIAVRALDASGALIKGTKFQWFLNGQDGGESSYTDGLSSYELMSDAVVSVRSEYDGIVLGPVTLSSDQTWYDFHFDLTVRPTWLETVVKQLPAIVGLALILLVVVLGFAFANPSPIQTHILLAVLSIGGGAFGGVISGFIKADIKLGTQVVISAGGAAAIFALLYFFPPHA
ncbi:MAG: hypothetical protein WDM91_17540 [Rhizomicrobium sp.]